MTTRKLIRPSLGRTVRLDAHSRPARRKGPPTDQTHAESSYLHQAIENRAVFVASLLGGEDVVGRLEFYDRDCFKIIPAEGTPILLRKERVKYYRMESGAPKRHG